MLRKSVAKPWPVIGAAVGMFVLAMVTFSFLGREFTPQLDEKDLAVQALRIVEKKFASMTPLSLTTLTSAHAFQSLFVMPRSRNCTGLSEDDPAVSWANCSRNSSSVILPSMVLAISGACVGLT